MVFILALFRFIIYFDNPMNILTLQEVCSKITAIEQKLDSVIFRLETCERFIRQSSLDSNRSEENNPLDHYLKTSKVDSCAAQMFSRRIKQQLQQSESKWKSYPQKMAPLDDKKFDMKEHLLDSRSFAMIKRSILTNSDEIEQMKERLMDVERQYIKRIMGVQQAITILANVSAMIETKLSQVGDKLKIDKDSKTSAQNIKSSNYKMSRMMDKYQGEDVARKLFDTIEKYI